MITNLRCAFLILSWNGFNDLLLDWLLRTRASFLEVF
jgi:hypothetical protein